MASLSVIQHESLTHCGPLIASGRWLRLLPATSRSLTSFHVLLGSSGPRILRSGPEVLARSVPMSFSRPHFLSTSSLPSGSSLLHSLPHSRAHSRAHSLLRPLLRPLLPSLPPSLLPSFLPSFLPFFLLSLPLTPSPPPLRIFFPTTQSCL